MLSREFPGIFYNPDMFRLICRFLDWHESYKQGDTPEDVFKKMAISIYSVIQNKDAISFYSFLDACPELFYVENALGEMPVYHVAKNNFDDIRWRFKASRPDYDFYRVNKDGLSQFELAFANGDGELIRRFQRDYAVDINHRSSSGRLPIEFAIQTGNLDSVLKMRELGAKFDGITVCIDGIIPALIQRAETILSQFSELGVFECKSQNPKMSSYSRLATLEKNFVRVLQNLQLMREQLEMTFPQAVSSHIPNPTFSLLPGVLLSMISAVLIDIDIPMWSIGGTSSLAILLILSSFVRTAKSLYEGPLSYVTELRMDKNANLLLTFKEHLPGYVKICQQWVDLLRDVKLVVKRHELSQRPMQQASKNPFSFVRKLMSESKPLPDCRSVLSCQRKLASKQL